MRLAGDHNAPAPISFRARPKPWTVRSLVQQHACRVHSATRQCNTPAALPECEMDKCCLGRRSLFAAGTAVLLAAMLHASPANAGLLQLPAVSLNNRYLLVRAGESEALAADSTLTNPVWKTSLGNGLTSRGKAQVYKQTLPALQALGACGESSCWLWPSITQNAYQTAEILAYATGMGRSRIVPEYSFLDQRGLGRLDGLKFDTAYSQVHDGDLLAVDWRPPPGSDGTPNESIADVLVRLRQLLSITETQYLNEDVVIIASDSETLDILQVAVSGQDLRRHAEYAFAPGEVRQLQLAQTSWDPTGRTFACPHPPACK